MKRLTILILAIFLSAQGFSQIQSVKAGFIFIPQVTNITSFDFNKMEVETPLLSNVIISTKKTYHNFCYVWGNNALVIVNGWVYHPQEKQDLYLVTSKNFASPGGNIMIAWEIELAKGNAWGAVEVGTAWDKWDKPIVNLSLTIPFYLDIWKRK